MSNASTREEVLEAMRKAKEALKARTMAPEGSAVSSAKTFAEVEDNGKHHVVRGNNSLNAKDNLKEFLSYYFKVVQQFILDRTKFELEIPHLTANDRRVLHSLANSCNLAHESKGSGEKRSLFLKKDTIFYGKQDMYLNVDLEDIAKNVVSKTSKYELRFTHRGDLSDAPKGSIGSYDDEVALDGLLRFRRATDAYRHAVQLGTSTEELIESEQPGQRLEDILRGDTGTGSASASPSETPRAIAMKLAAAKGALEAAPAEEDTTSSSVKAPVRSYNELCRTCGTKHRIDYDVAQWNCSKRCQVCGRDTIWALEEVQGGVAPATTTTGGQKRGREEEEADEEAPDIDVEDEEPYELEDMLEMMSLNDYSSEDISGLRRFGERFTSEVLPHHLLFLSDIADLKHHRHFLFSNGDASPKKQKKETLPLYIVLRESSTLSKRVSTLLEELMLNAFSAGQKGGEEGKVPSIDKELSVEEAAPYVGVVCPVGSSVYGKEAALLVQLRPTHEVPLHKEGLEGLTRQYGAKHFFMTEELSAAVARMEE